MYGAYGSRQRNRVEFLSRHDRDTPLATPCCIAPAALCQPGLPEGQGLEQQQTQGKMRWWRRYMNRDGKMGGIEVKEKE